MESSFIFQLLDWYDHQNIQLPWRGAADPYLVWLSEIMLQQTQVAAVIPYFARFTARFPTVTALADAPLDDVLKLWEGLGYYSRARNLHRAAQIVRDEYGGKFPVASAELLKLPGIGRYTAGAIASIAGSERVAALDGNMIRVLSRLFDIESDVTETSTQRRLWELAGSLVPAERPGDYNQAVMDLGRTVCKPKTPLCKACPVSQYCAAYQLDVQDARPVKPAKAATPHYDVAAGIVYNQNGQFLIAQRPNDGLLGGLWEFPGGKQEAGETLAECVQRELREELAIEVEVGDLLTTVRHAFTHFKITLAAFECRHISDTPQAIGCQAWRWVTLAEVDQFAFGKADLQVIRALREKPLRLL
jgi:A/G-specific adenine glycosylase